MLKKEKRKKIRKKNKLKNHKHINEVDELHLEYYLKTRKKSKKSWI